MGRPLIGITSCLEPARWGDWVREAVLSPATYSRAVDRCGGIPVLLAPVTPSVVTDLLARLDGLVLTEGADVDPALYGASRHPHTGEPDRNRDRFELALVRAAIDARLPFLGVGRGLHVLNVARGGTLTQYLPDTVGHDQHQPDPVKPGRHELRVRPDSRLAQILGVAAVVSSAHQQGLHRLGSGLRVVGWADDDVVEAVELEGHPFGLGVQWRVEEGDDLRLLTALVAQAAARPARSA